MNLAWKLFLSYMVVILVGMIVLGVSTAFVAPETFARHVAEMGSMMNSDMQNSMMQADQSLDANFRQAVNSSLLVTSLAATLAAGIVSWYVSQRIVQPIRQTVKASQRIAAGSYDERLPVYSRDELGELAESFNKMALALADIEAMRQQLIADVSHELKTPLASIKGYMEGMQDGVIEPTPETFQQVEREASRLQRLVHDLQELSRAEVAQFRLDPQIHDGYELVAKAAEWLRPQFDDKGVALILEPPDAAIQIRVDYDRMRQVLLNLLGNALQYTPAGGQVTVRLQRDKEHARFLIQDTGIGLERNDLERVFHRFYRADKSRSRTSGGSGIGLTIALHIVHSHGGKIWAESGGTGQGSTFQFTLPLA